MSELEALGLADNHFAGTFPPQRAVLSYLVFVSVMGNMFEGTLPSQWAVLPQLHLLWAGDTLMEGSLPTSLGAEQPRLTLVSMRALQLEGSIPRSLSRMSMHNVTLVMGFGHRGKVPVVYGTILAVSIFHNDLEGHLPKLQLATSSFIVAHSNLLSCNLPSCGSETPTVSLALLGNRFQDPTAYPPWIHGFERGGFFVVSNRGARDLMRKVLAGGSFLVLSWFLTSFIKLSRSTSPRAQAALKSAMQLSFQSHAGFTAFACVVLLFYVRGPVHSCVTLLARLRMPVLNGQHLLLGLVQMAFAVHIFTRTRALCEQMCRNSTPHNSKLRQRPTHPELTASVARAFAVWLLLCCCISCPGALYSMLKTIPGFFEAAEWVARLVSQSVSLCTSFVTTTCLPPLAARMEEKVTKLPREELLSIANLFTFPLMPCLVTFACDPECLSRWTQFWQPCIQSPSPLDAMEHVRLPFFQHSFATGTTEDNSLYNELLVRRKMLCTSVGRVSAGRCLDSILARSSSLLLQTAANLAFTGPALRAMLSRPTKPRAAWVHLLRMWALMLIFGASVPLLCQCAASSFLIETWLLFGSPGLLGQDEESNNAGSSGQGGIPTLSLRLAMVGGMMLQLALAFTSSLDVMSVA